MKLSDKAIAAIKGKSRLKNLLALEMNCTVYTIDRWIKENNDSLTKAAALAVIKEETGLSDVEILEAEAVEAGK